jgi:hypothetical protein
MDSLRQCGVPAEAVIVLTDQEERALVQQGHDLRSGHILEIVVDHRGIEIVMALLLAQLREPGANRERDPETPRGALHQPAKDRIVVEQQDPRVA